MSIPEQSARPNFAIRMPMPVKLKFESSSSDVTAEVCDLSAHGIFFLLNPAPLVGAQFTFTITLSEEITLTETIRLSCKGRVTRVEESEAGQPPRVTANIESYESAVADGDRT